MNYDPRLAPIANPDGSINPAALEALSDKDPGTMTIPELQVVQALLDDHSVIPPGVQIAIDLAAFTKATGGTITRETVRHGKTVERSVRRYRGREDVRRFRAQQPTAFSAGVVRTRQRERRPGATRRTASSSSTSSADPGDPNEPAPATLRVRRPSGLLDVFIADHVIVGASSITATGRWRRRVGLNNAEFRWSPPGTYTWPAKVVREVAS